MSNPTFKLRRTKDGQWECWTSVGTDPTRTTTYGPTPDQAVARMEAHLADFEEYVSHSKGTCNPDACSRCKDSDDDQRGCWVPEGSGTAG